MNRDKGRGPCSWTWARSGRSSTLSPRSEVPSNQACSPSEVFGNPSSITHAGLGLKMPEGLPSFWRITQLRPQLAIVVPLLTPGSPLTKEIYNSSVISRLRCSTSSLASTTNTSMTRLAMPRSRCKMNCNRTGSSKFEKISGPKCFKAKQGGTNYG